LKPKTFILNGKTVNLTHDISNKSDVMSMDVYGVKQMERAFQMLYDNAMLSRRDISQARRIMRYHLKPLVTKMRSLVPRGEKSKNPGNLKKSIGVVDSKRYRKIPVVYAGARRGRNQKNDGWYAHIVEHGRKAITAEGNRYLYFTNKDGSMVKVKTVAGFSGRYFFKRAMDSEGQKAINNIMNTFAQFYGEMWERAAKPEMKV
jgi:hypothetical protein